MGKIKLRDELLKLVMGGVACEGRTKWYYRQCGARFKMKCNRH